MFPTLASDRKLCCYPVQAAEVQHIESALCIKCWVV